ncbi:hypothetical protein AGMMS50276_30710 [Synergistales bacterium]|nr:hypothetical protein AGMMS50276_30710 [Synergistales bacterium]
MVGKIAESSFLRDNAQKWMSFDWILNENNLTKIIEGKYDDKAELGDDADDLIPVIVDDSEVAI